ncbi:hypothetical protein CBR_g3182 [Chara braunii]|uniref:Uncharacterized protein n=1 Tax=Chara braunii TaxID=69332 RepID=A0A388KF30_CHABU|nr:hypothetical protein CBR_g3182 [Chara braunii]|eukprot:GBG68641.1 hypothetical protein CBR_g3182 [Chara braunii]
MAGGVCSCCLLPFLAIIFPLVSLAVLVVGSMAVPIAIPVFVFQCLYELKREWNVRRRQTKMQSVAGAVDEEKFVLRGSEEDLENEEKSSMLPGKDEGENQDEIWRGRESVAKLTKSDAFIRAEGVDDGLVQPLPAKLSPPSIFSPPEIGGQGRSEEEEEEEEEEEVIPPSPSPSVLRSRTEEEEEEKEVVSPSPSPSPLRSRTEEEEEEEEDSWTAQLEKPLRRDVGTERDLTAIKRLIGERAIDKALRSKSAKFSLLEEVYVIGAIVGIDLAPISWVNVSEEQKAKAGLRLIKLILGLEEGRRGKLKKNV